MDEGRWSVCCPGMDASGVVCELTWLDGVGVVCVLTWHGFMWGGLSGDLTKMELSILCAHLAC